MNILLGLTGSVATTVAPKLIAKLKEMGEVKIVGTRFSDPFTFYSPEKMQAFKGTTIYSDEDEWAWKDENGETRNYYKKNDPVLHIELRKWASIFVIAPLSANTLAKMANGICDNLLTSVLRAWDFTRPIVLAPAMNTFMWQHPTTEKHLTELQSWGAVQRLNTIKVAKPTSKTLACGDEGIGAMANIDDIVALVQHTLQWWFPVNLASGIPVADHPGAFSVQRKHSKHTGVDLYALEGSPVMAVESGRVVAVEHFTGPQDNSPWWENTDCVLVEGPSGVVCYGEIEPHVKVGDELSRGEILGYVIRVLKAGKERPDIPGHRPSMLHMELYPFGTRKPSEGFSTDLRDPTPQLLDAYNAPGKLEVKE
jgi:phosphopantothenoylcysteine decarboxylase